MHILITNDDGYTSKGLQALIEMARGFGEITVVAPQYPQSAMSNAVSIGKLLRMVPVGNPKVPRKRVSAVIIVPGHLSIV